MRYFTIILAAMTAGIALTLFPLGVIVSLLFLLCIYLVRKLTPGESRNFLVKLFIAGFAIRAVLAVLNYSAGLIGPYHAADTQPDAIIYNSNAVYIGSVVNGPAYLRGIRGEPFLRDSITQRYRIYKGELPPTHTYQFGFYVYLLGVLYAFLGYSPIAAKILNGLFGCLIAITVYSIAKGLFRSERVAKTSAAVVMFFPSIIFWSATLLQDTLVNLLFLIYVLSILLYLSKGRKACLLAAFILSVLLGLFKGRFAPLFLAGVSLILVFKFFNSIQKKKMLTRVFLLIGISILLSAMVILRFQYINDVITHYMTSVFNYHKSAVVSYPTASSYTLYNDLIYMTKGLDLNYLLNHTLLFSITKAIAYYFFSPFPWHTHLMRSHPFLWLFYPQVIFTLIMMPFMILGVLSSIRKNSFVTLSLISLLALCILPQAMAEAIIGNIARHRDMFMPLIIIFSTYGFYLTRASIKKDADSA